MGVRQALRQPLLLEVITITSSAGIAATSARQPGPGTARGICVGGSGFDFRLVNPLRAQIGVCRATLTSAQKNGIPKEAETRCAATGFAWRARRDSNP